MDANNIKLDKASGVEDHFQVLPNEVLLFIFHKMADLKNLCRCSMVSKRFDSVISEIRAVSIILPKKEASICESRTVKSLLGLKLTFLEKFPRLESVFLEYDSSLLKWKINCRNEASMIESLVAILPVSVHKKSEFVPNQELLTLRNSTNLVESRFNDCLWLSSAYFKESLTLTHMLIKRHATLRCVTITDSMKQSKLVIKDEQLLKIRSYLLDNKQVFRTPSLVKVAWVPELHLPLSGYVMRGVCLMIMKSPKESDATDNNREDDDIMTWDFDEDGELLGEAIKEIFKNNRDNLMAAR